MQPCGQARTSRQLASSAPPSHCTTNLAHPHPPPSNHSSRWGYQSSHACAATCSLACAPTLRPPGACTPSYTTPPPHRALLWHALRTCAFCTGSCLDNNMHFLLSDVRSMLTRVSWCSMSFTLPSHRRVQTSSGLTTTGTQSCKRTCTLLGVAGWSTAVALQQAGGGLLTKIAGAAAGFVLRASRERTVARQTKQEERTTRRVADCSLTKCSACERRPSLCCGPPERGLKHGNETRKEDSGRGRRNKNNRKPREKTKQAERRNKGVRDAKVLVGYGAWRRRLRPLLLASTTNSAHTDAGATLRNWLPAGTDGPSTEQRQALAR
jgi:hypothetical protein